MFGAPVLNYVVMAPDLRELIDILWISFTSLKDTKHFLFQRNVKFKVEEENVTVFLLILKDAK